MTSWLDGGGGGARSVAPVQTCSKHTDEACLIKKRSLSSLARGLACSVVEVVVCGRVPSEFGNRHLLVQFALEWRCCRVGGRE